VILTNETLINDTLLGMLPTGCEIVSAPVLQGYPYQLMQITGYGTGASEQKITVTPRVVESLY
jgi:hypothetical protein